MKAGGSASVTAIPEVIALLDLGFATGKMLGWSGMDSIFLGGILSISSTTIIIRAFDELNVKSQKFARLAFGVLAMAPFLWALAVSRNKNEAYNNLWMNRRFSRAPLIALKVIKVLLAVIFTGFLFSLYFTLNLAIVVVLALLAVVLLFFRRNSSRCIMVLSNGY